MAKKTRHEPHEEHADESWLLPYSDLMTLLLALFIVLYGMSSTDAKKFETMSKAFSVALNGGVGVLDQSSLEGDTMNMNKDTIIQKNTTDNGLLKKQQQSAMMRKEEEDLERVKKQLDQYIKQSGLTNQLSTKLNQSQLMITISDKALFSSGKANLKPEARQLGIVISTMLQVFPDYEVIVSGHTDDIPISNREFSSNWDLSSTRALNFMSVLLENDKLDPKKFSAIGYGEYRPVASNDTIQGRSENRRVEVSILRKYQELVETLNTPGNE